MATKGNPLWEQFEKAVQSLLSLRSTPGSGNQWHAPSDGASQPDDPYKVMVDCKHTQRATYSLSLPMLNQWWEKATMLGFHFALPLRMLGAERDRQKEWVVIPLDDYAELVSIARVALDPTRCGHLPGSSRGGMPCVRHTHHEGKHDNGEIEWGWEDWPDGHGGWGQGTVNP